MIYRTFLVPKNFIYILELFGWKILNSVEKDGKIQVNCVRESNTVTRGITSNARTVKNLRPFYMRFSFKRLLSVVSRLLKERCLRLFRQKRG